MNGSLGHFNPVRQNPLPKHSFPYPYVEWNSCCHRYKIRISSKQHCNVRIPKSFFLSLNLSNVVSTCAINLSIDNSTRSATAQTEEHKRMTNRKRLYQVTLGPVSICLCSRFQFLLGVAMLSMNLCEAKIPLNPHCIAASSWTVTLEGCLRHHCDNEGFNVDEWEVLWQLSDLLWDPLGPSSDLVLARRGSKCFNMWVLIILDGMRLNSTNCPGMHMEHFCDVCYCSAP